MTIQHEGGFLMSKIQHISGRIFSRMLREYDVDINPAQGRIMFVLWQEDALPIRDLAKRTSLGKSTLTSMLDRLEAAGLIVRERSEIDRRLIVVNRTEKDRSRQRTYEKVSEQMSAIYYAKLTKKEIASFERTLVKILASLTEHEQGGEA